MNQEEKEHFPERVLLFLLGILLGNIIAGWIAGYYFQKSIDEINPSATSILGESTKKWKYCNLYMDSETFNCEGNKGNIRDYVSIYAEKFNIKSG